MRISISGFGSLYIQGLSERATKGKLQYEEYLDLLLEEKLKRKTDGSIKAKIGVERLVMLLFCCKLYTGYFTFHKKTVFLAWLRCKSFARTTGHCFQFLLCQEMPIENCHSERSEEAFS